ncbi:MAG: rhomboid family intramembrane serine protease [Myxococcales bacterium]|nr:rhomboid family intramembrane serine protease [Myxococcales bacterium]
MAPPPRGRSSPPGSFRAAGPTWLGARPTSGATLLLILETAAFLVVVFLTPGLREWVTSHLALVPRRALGPEPWQLVTSGLIHLNPLALAGSLMGIWFCATALEQLTSKSRMLTTFVVAQIAGAAAIAAVGRLLSPEAIFGGCSPGVAGMIAGFGVYLGAVPVHLFGMVQMRGRTAALLFLGLPVLIDLLNQQWIGLAGWLAGAAAGYALATGATERILLAWDRFRLWRLRRRYKVIQGGRDPKRFVN